MSEQSTTMLSEPPRHQAVNFSGAVTGVREVARRKQIQLIAGCVLGLCTGFAGLYIGSLTIFLKPIAMDFGWGRAEISAAVVMAMLGLAVGSPIQGYLIDRIGARRVILGSVVLLSASIVALSMIPNNIFLFAAICFAIGALGVATGPNGYLSLLPHWFDKRLGLALACAMVGVGIGTATNAPLAQSLVTSGGWRHAYHVLAGVALVGGFISYLMIGVGAPHASKTKSGKAEPDFEGVSFAEGVRDIRMLLIAVALALGGAAGLGMTFHTAPLLSDIGFSPAEIGSVVALSGVGLIVGRFAGGALLDLVPARIVGAATYLLGGLSLVIMGLDLTHSYPLIAFGGLLLGFALGTEGDFAAFAVRRYFGMRAFGSLYGCVFAAYSVGSVAGVILWGWAFDTFGSYVGISTVCIGAYLIAGLFALLLGPYRYASSKD